MRKTLYLMQKITFLQSGVSRVISAVVVLPSRVLECLTKQKKTRKFLLLLDLGVPLLVHVRFVFVSGLE